MYVQFVCIQQHFISSERTKLNGQMLSTAKSTFYDDEEEKKQHTIQYKKQREKYSNNNSAFNARKIYNTKK